jgi:tetratricopeptide (TPR) repeat protein
MNLNEQWSFRSFESCLAEYPRRVALFIFLLASLVYINSFPGAFILDDIHIAQNNPLVKNFEIITIFSSDYWHGMENSGLFRPLTILSLAINRLFLGGEPWAFHGVNVLLHGAVTVLFWRVLIGWGVPLVSALLAAALFAVHPIHTEVVDVVVGRSELLVALFLLLAFLAAQSQERRWQALSALSLFCSLLSKENAITFLLMLPLVDAYFAGTLTIWQKRWRLYALLFGTTLLWFLWRSFGVFSDLPRSTLSEAAAPLAHVDAVIRMLSALQHQWIYLKLHFWPIPLQSVYSVADLPPFITSPLSLPGLLVLAATGALFVVLYIGIRQRQPAAFFGLLYIASFSITANLLFPIGVTMAERLAYIPSLWFCAAVGSFLGQADRKPQFQRVACVCAVLLLLFYATVCLLRNLDYADEPTLWMGEVRQNPKDFLGWQNVGEILTNHKRYVEAEAAYRQMLELAPGYPGGLRSWTFYLLTQERYNDALESARRAFAISEKKGERVAISFDSLDIAEALSGLGRYDEALKALEPATAILPTLSRYQELRARALNALEQDSEAIDAFAKVKTIAPGSNLHLKLAISLLRLQRLDEAREQLRQDIKLRGGTGETLNLLGVVEAQQEKWPAALDAFDRALELDPGNRYYQENFARARTMVRPAQ